MVGGNAERLWRKGEMVENYGEWVGMGRNGGQWLGMVGNGNECVGMDGKWEWWAMVGNW